MMITKERPGKLYIVSTPIGNLSDMTFRAVDILKNVDLIAAEDTRHTSELLNYFEIKTKLTSYHEHNENEKADKIIAKIEEGLNVAVVTDAGTPIISDPGNILVKKAIEKDIFVSAVPGACAAINALVLSGLSSENFIFVGFLSDDNKKRKKQLEKLKNETMTMIFYISPHSLKKDLEFLKETFGERRQVSLSREMTKIHEETIRGSFSEVIMYSANSTIRGEYVLVVEGIDGSLINEENIWDKMTIKEHFEHYLDKDFSEKEAIKMVAKDRNVDKNEVYKIIKARS